MLDVKPVLSSKTVLMNLALAVLAVLVFFHVLPASVNGEGTVAILTVVGNLLAVVFRKNATARLGTVDTGVIRR